MTNDSPFSYLEVKQSNYFSFHIVKKICNSDPLTRLFQAIHSIERDDDNYYLNNIRIALIQLANKLSRIVYVPDEELINLVKEKIDLIEVTFISKKILLGNSLQIIEDSLSILKSIIADWINTPPCKAAKIKDLLKDNTFSYIICLTEDDALDLRRHVNLPNETKVISFSMLDEDSILQKQKLKTLVIGWLNYRRINKITLSFLFSEITFLFYSFENDYYESLQRRNLINIENIKPVFPDISDKDIENNFEYIFNGNANAAEALSNELDVQDFELRLENYQYSKYKSGDNLLESVKAKRIDFYNDYFVYAIESHKFLTITNNKDGKSNLYKRGVQLLRPNDVIVFINTHREILAKLVEINTNKEDLELVKTWTELWKDLLKRYFISIGGNFQKLVQDLRNCDCKRHPATIKSWLQDENKIGPEKNIDLISIALLTSSSQLYDNIDIVRDSIRKMIGWRMKASDYITEKIKLQLQEIAIDSLVNKKVSIEGLGSFEVLKIFDISSTWDKIDLKYANKLLEREII